MEWAKLRKLRVLIRKAAESLSDEEALDGMEMFAPWEVDTDYISGDRRRYGEKLYKCRQNHHSQSDWAPDAAPSLWEEIAKPGSGETPDDPIAYNNNMALEQGKYYIQFSVVYICIRDTQIPVYNNLADLVGNYVEVYNPDSNLESMLSK